MKTDKRQCNFELLRILAMLFIITGHLLGDSGGNLLGKQVYFTFPWFLLWAVEAFCVAGTNCFVLISGYFLIYSQFSWTKILRICIEVWFYSIVLYSLCYYLGFVEFKISDLRLVFSPILGRTWWFVSSYIGMYMLSPYINAFLLSIDEKTHKSLITISLLLFSVISTFYPFTDTFSVGGGSGIVWFITLYLIAAYIRLHFNSSGISQKRIIICYFSAVILMIVSKYLLTYLTIKVLGSAIGTSVFYSNSSILNTIASVCLFILFICMDMSKVHRFIRVIINTGGMVSFGVYLLHNNPWFSPTMWMNIVKKSIYIVFYLYLLQSY